MKYNFSKAIGTIYFLLLFICASAQQIFFKDIPEHSIQTVASKRVIVPEKYRTIQLDSSGLRAFISLLPSEKNITNKNLAPIISIPMPDGRSAAFRVWESSVMAPELAAAYPELKTFTGQGIDDPTATIKLDWTTFGFHAMILSPVTGSILIDPYDQQTLTNYISYYKTDLKKKGIYHELPPIVTNETAKPANVLTGVCVGTQLRTFRLAIACTHEYAIAATGLPTPTKAQVLAKIVTSANRVNGVYEKELSIRLVLVANNTNVIFVSAATDPFKGNNNANVLINESQQKIDSAIGNANYDIGHTFSTGGGGLANLGVVCQTGWKAKGITGSPNPTGDPYDIDYVAHEMGHEFGANHPFNSDMGFCSGNGVAGFNAEPGSGSSIMAYAGICDADNLQPNSDPQFHGVSFDEISVYSNNSSGNTCAVKTSTGNSPPVVNAGSAYTIPISTTFVLTGSATDVNGDALTYSWEQMDVNGTFGAWNSPSGNAPLFRSFNPVSSPLRYFPKLATQIANARTGNYLLQDSVIGELLPTYSRTMNFRLTARDNKAGGGGVCYAQTTVMASSAAGPFIVTAPNNTGIVWTEGDFKTVTWNVTNTNLAPISCANVTIQLSTDGGNTFPITILASTPNDGAEEIIVPNNISTTARIRVMAVGNIFYDFSNNNFTIQAAPAATFIFNNPPNVSVCLSTNGVATLRTSGQGGFNTSIALSASQVPAGTTVSFGSTSVTPGLSTTVTLNNASSLAAGLYTIRITGIAGAETKTRDISFIVGSSPAAPVLSTPVNDSIGLPTLPTFNWNAVSGAISYTLEISTSSTFATITQTISNAISPYTLTTALSQDLIYFWRVKTTNSCGSGSGNAVPFRFKTGVAVCNTINNYVSADIPKIISAIGTPTINSSLTIPAIAGAIADVNVVGLIGTHTYISDLTFTLTSPGGKTDTLFDQICSTGAFENFNLNLDDQAGTATFPCPPVGSITVKPQSPLAAFNGQNSGGVWILNVSDAFNGDGGSLNGWGLKITTCSIIPTPLINSYTFTGDGNWSVASNWVNNLVPPATLPYGATININHIVKGKCILDVTQHISAGASIIVLTGKNLLVPGALTIQ
jgi:subtilisin-like proprotein convertase family protein